MKSLASGTIIWLLPPGLSRDLEQLPRERQEEIRQIIRRRMTPVAAIFIGLLKRPQAEQSFGHELDLALSELVDHLADVLEKPPVIH